VWETLFCVELQRLTPIVAFDVEIIARQVVANTELLYVATGIVNDSGDILSIIPKPLLLHTVRDHHRMWDFSDTGHRKLDLAVPVVLHSVTSEARPGIFHHARDID
jgi:hypothetical protein